VTLQFTGPGSSIPGFAAIVSTELAMKVEVDPDYAAYDGVQVGAQGSELLDAVKDTGLLRRLNLPPRTIALRASAMRLRRWLWTGAAVAIVLVISDGLRYGARLNDLQQEADSQTARADEVQAMQIAGKKLMDAIDAMRTMNTLMSIELGATVNYRACLSEITRLTPVSVKLENVRFSMVEGKMTGSISGCAFVEDSSGRSTQLESFIGTLRESPLFDDVSLHNVHMSEIQTRNAQTFEVRLSGVAAPSDELARRVAATDGSEGGQP
jgi:Tfp pilus assembly protein PilN